MNNNTYIIDFMIEGKEQIQLFESQNNDKGLKSLYDWADKNGLNINTIKIMNIEQTNLGSKKQ